MGNGPTKMKTNTGEQVTTSPSKVVLTKTAAHQQPRKKTFKESYSLSKDLGSGAFSVVKLATHKVSGTNTAVKIITKRKLTDEDLAALMTEISILREMDHPHIIKCYETFDEGQEYYIVTELVAGGELFDRIVAKTHYTEKEARDLVKMFLETMAYMHEAGVVHRDLKPENLLLCSDLDDSNIKIADFGFAKKTTSLLPNESACGTPGYVAPEILRGDRYGTEVDIWSMGVICYVLLAGYPPFYDEDQKKLFRKIKEGKYHFHADYWSNTSPEAIDLIRKMLCVNQRERWTARRLLSHPWITAGDDELRAKDLSKSIAAMKKYKAKMRFRAVTNAIIMTNRMKGRFRSSTKSPESTTPSEKTEEKINMLLDDSKSDPDAETGELSLKDDSSPVSTSVSMPHSPPAEAEHSDTYVDTEEEIQARIAAAAERKKSKMLIITHAALDDSSLEEDDSHMRACID